MQGDITEEIEPSKQTAVVTKFYYYLSSERKDKARNLLYQKTKGTLYRAENAMTDVFLEELWNTLVGNE